MSAILSLPSGLRNRRFAPTASSIDATATDDPSAHWADGAGGERALPREHIAPARLEGRISVSSLGTVQALWSELTLYLSQLVDAAAVNQPPWYDLRYALAREHVNIVGENQVRAYLEQHPDLLGPVERVCQSARREFGPGASLSLEVYRDPEVADEYLRLCVRLLSYPTDTLRRIRAVSEPHERDLEDKSGTILVTTDFCPTR